MFVKAADCEPEVKPQALTNLALLEKERVQRALAGGNAAAARTHGLQAGRYLDEAKPLFDALIPLFPNDEGLRHYASGWDQLRIFVFRLAGAALLQLGEFADCEAEMTRLVDMFPDAWESHAMMWTMHEEDSACEGEIRGVGSCWVKQTVYTFIQYHYYKFLAARLLAPLHKPTHRLSSVPENTQGRL